MIKGCKHYFTMFGIMRSTINIKLTQFYSQMIELSKYAIPIKVKIVETYNQKLEKNQTYQG